MGKRVPEPTGTTDDNQPEQQLADCLKAAAGKLLIWMVAGVGLALIPIIIKAGRGNKSLDELLGEGEVLIIAAIIVAAAAVDLAMRPPKLLTWPLLRAGLIGVCFLFACISAGWFADVDTLKSVGQAMAADDVAAMTKLAFVMNLTVAGCCVLVSEL